VRKFAALISFLIIALALTMSAMVALGRATPLPEDVTFLHLGDMCELPCWIGITPGEMTTDEAWKIISKVYHLGSWGGPGTFTTPSGIKFRIILNNDYSLPEQNQPLGEIKIILPEYSELSLGYAVSVMGLPKEVTITPGAVQLHREWGKIEIWGHPHFFDDYLRTPRQVFMKRPIDSISLFANQSTPPNSLNWNGFRIYQFEKTSRP
jgi:hypothetical protein